MTLLDTFNEILQQLQQEQPAVFAGGVAHSERPPTPQLAPADTEALNDWLALVRHATTQKEVFAIVDEFRPLPWSDQQRAQLSRVYVRRLEWLAGLS